MPDWKPEILRRLASLKLAPTREVEIADELAQHRVPAACDSISQRLSTFSALQSLPVF
ncbi:MAG TPA: hypothetical protein VGU63_07275 [Candidatus Acidoferrales bacterium]|nr:hypothetical protein [Candidatus Acidoferrales bacterium]